MILSDATLPPLPPAMDCGPTCLRMIVKYYGANAARTLVYHPRGGGIEKLWQTLCQTTYSKSLYISKKNFVEVLSISSL